MNKRFDTIIENLQLYNFRNYVRCETEISKFSAFIGKNGGGKTNLLEAVSLLTPGKGLRSALINNLVNNTTSNNNFLINAKIKSELSTNYIKILSEIDNTTSTLKKNYFIDDTPIKKQSELGNYLSIVWLTPQMDTFFLEDNNNKRKFLDRLIFNFDNAHLGRLNSYTKAVRERNQILKQNSNTSWLNAIEEIIVEKGVAITATRLDFINKMNNILQTHASGFAKISLQLDGFVEDTLKNNSALHTENIFKEKLLSLRKIDSLTATTSKGPHKSSFSTINLQKNTKAELCSTGEQKLMLITIIIAFTYLLSLEKISPILLLDEVLVHLDESTKHNFISRLIELDTQCLITSTDIDILGDYSKSFRFYEVVNNNINKL